VPVAHRFFFHPPLTNSRTPQLFLSPFTEEQRRITADTALLRNYFVAALVDSIFIAYAAPNSKTEQFCQEIITWGKSINTFERNTNLLNMGAQPIDNHDLKFERLDIFITP